MKREEEEKKNKRRGLLIAFFLHVILIGLALFPFMRYSLQQDVPLTEAVEVMIFDFSRKEGASARARKEPKQEMVKKSPAPASAEIFKIEPLPVPDVITTDAPEKIKLPEPSMPKVEEVPQAESSVVDAVEAVDPSPSTSEEATNEAPSGDNQTGTSSTEGNTDAIEGEGKGSRYDGLDLSGNGVLTRKVISRAELSDIIKQNGVFVVNICVNQRGIVVAAKFNEELSTINDPELIRRAIDAAMKYKFEVDYSAAPKQCGRMTFTVKGIK